MTTSLVWFRRDLRIADNTALHHALSESDHVYGCFCFDREILDPLQDRADARVEFIRGCLEELDGRFRRHKSSLIVRHARAREEIPRLARQLGVDRVYASHDAEPLCLERDREVAVRLTRDGRELRTCKDHVLFERSEILNKAGEPFRVYTHYRNAWRALLDDQGLEPWPSERLLRRLAPVPSAVRSDPWSLEDLGFRPAGRQWKAGSRSARAAFDAFLTRVTGYTQARDHPAVEGTSRLSMHLRFGTLGIRSVLLEALDHGGPGANKWVDELVWREFYNMILHHFPHTEHHPFQPAFEAFPWKHDEQQFARWCEGRTGYPIVDAGMRELNTTGYMHNRLRMITASFLTKDLLIDWKWGERYFAAKLIDFDLSQNLGGWQWSAGIGTDAQPFFRIFNPVTQSQRFDAEGVYIRRYVPELAALPAKFVHAPWTAPESVRNAAACLLDKTYPSPMVDHARAREDALAAFQSIRRSAASTLAPRPRRP